MRSAAGSVSIVAGSATLGLSGALAAIDERIDRQDHVPLIGIVTAMHHGSAGGLLGHVAGRFAGVKPLPPEGPRG